MQPRRKFAELRQVNVGVEPVTVKAEIDRGQPPGDAFSFAEFVAFMRHTVRVLARARVTAQKEREAAEGQKRAAPPGPPPAPEPPARPFLVEVF